MVTKTPDDTVFLVRGVLQRQLNSMLRRELLVTPGPYRSGLRWSSLRLANLTAITNA